MRSSYATLVEPLCKAVQEGTGETATALRERISRRAGEHCFGSASAELPADLVAYVDKVALHAYKVTDDDIAALKRAGRSEDEIFEVTVAAALGAAMKRLDIGLDALAGGRE